MRATTFHNLIMLLQCGVALLLTCVLYYFYRQHNRHYLKLWSGSWLALSVYLSGGAVAESASQSFSPLDPLRISLSIVTLAGGYLQVVLLLGGSYEIASGSKISGRLLKTGVAIGIALALATSLAFINDPELTRERFIIKVGLRCFVAGLAFIGGAYGVFYHWTRKKGLGRKLVGFSFVFYGLDQLNYFVLTLLDSVFLSYTLYLMMIDVLLQAAIGLGLVIWLQEEEHQQLLKYSDELHKSEDRYRNVVESQTEMVCRYLPDTTITFVNDAYCNYFGNAREELIGRKFLELAPANEHEGILKLIEKLVSSDRVMTNESEAISADDSRRWTHWSSSVIRNGNGEVVELQGVGRDITARRQAEQALGESEELFRSLTERVNAGIFIYREGRLLYANPAAESMTGYTKDDLLSMDVWDIALPDNREEIKKRVLARERGEGQPTRYEANILTKSGEARCLDVTADVIQYRGSRAVLITAFDLTDRKRAEDALRESELRNRALLEAIPDILFLHTTDGCYIDIYATNPGALIEKPDRLIGKRLEAVLPESVAKTIYGQFDDAIRTQEVQVCDYSLTLDGEARHFESRVVAVDQGKILRIVRDITKQKRAEEEARKLTSIVEASSEFIGLIGIDGRVLYINRAGRRLVGLKENEDIASKTVHDFFACEEHQRLIKEIIPSIKGGVSWEGEFRLRHYVTGDLIPVHQNAFAIRASNTDVTIALALISHDITRRKLAEDSLREQASLLDLTHDTIMVRDMNDVIIYWNHGAEEMYGWTSEEAIGKVSHTLLQTVFPQSLQTITEELTRSGRWEGELSHRRRDGMRITVASRWALQRADQSKSHAVLEINNDITERKRAERLKEKLRTALEKSLGEWRLTFDAIEYPVLILDSRGAIRRLNRVAREMLGAYKEEVLGCNIEEFSESQPWMTAAELVNRVQENGVSVSSSIRDDLSKKMWDISANFFAGPVAEDGVIVIARDITTLVDLQESLRRSETMAAMGTLVAGVAHEVRNPLFGISATLDAFESRFGDRDDYMRYASILRGEVERLNALMRGLLEFGKPHDLVMSKIFIGSLISTAISACSSLATRAEIQLTSAVSDDLPPVLVDSQRFIQVFQNLIENAIQHTPPGGIVTIKAECDMSSPELWVECAVRDSGEGFPQDDLANIFKPFFTRRRGGTGLGLSIVQRIVQEHGGAVSAVNEPDGGATVKVRLKATGE